MCVCVLFPIPCIIFALLFFSLPPIYSRNPDPGSHSRLFSPPPGYGSCLALLSRQEFSSFLPSSTRVELCLPTLLGARSQQLTLLFFFAKKKIKISPRRDSNSRTKTSTYQVIFNSRIRGLPQLTFNNRLSGRPACVLDVGG